MFTHRTWLPLLVAAALAGPCADVAERLQQPTFRTGNNLAAFDILVLRDRDGQPITDLAGQRQAGTAAVVPALVAKATDHLTEYFQALSAVVSEERYEQRAERRRLDRDWDMGRGLRRMIDVQERTLVSDFLLVQLPNMRGWHAFRDVYSVDGKEVRDRNDRLVKLFIEPHADRLAQADQIRDESSRYNIGAGTRDTNVPTFVLEFLLPSVRGRFAFRLGGTELIDGINAQIVVYQETARPTIITGEHDDDVPAGGQMWLDPDTGDVLKTRLLTSSGPVRTQIDVTYRLEPKLGLRVPAQMDERRTAVDEVLSGKATYSKFRRFTVETSEQIKKER